MSKFLLPTNINLTLEQKIRQFATRNKMIDIPHNCPKSKKKTICFCRNIENIDECEMFRIEKETNLMIRYMVTYINTKEQTEEWASV